MVLDSRHFRLACHEREAEWMAGELAQLESCYQRGARSAGLALSPGQRLTVRVLPSAAWSALRLYSDQTELQILSPYFIGWQDEVGEGYLIQWLAPSLLARLAFAAGVEDAAGSLASTRQIWTYSVLNAWGSEILGTDAPQVVSWALEAEPPGQASQGPGRAFHAGACHPWLRTGLV